MATRSAPAADPLPELGKADFFISYTRSDQEWALWIAWKLEHLGYTCVIQALDFKPGSNFISEMRSAIRNSAHLVAVLSPAYFESDFAQVELESLLAEDPRGLKGRILPVRVRDVRPTDLMKARVYVDLVGRSKEDAETELVEKVEAFLFDGQNAARRWRRKPDPFKASKTSDPTYSPRVIMSAIAGRSGAGLVNKPVVSVLFLTHHGNAQLDLLGQYKKMRRVIEKGKIGKQFLLTPRFDVTAGQMLDSLNETAPDIFHFSGKQDGGNIIIGTEDGGITTVSDTALVGLLNSLDKPPRIAILDTCYSTRGAGMLSQTVECAMGVSGVIRDDEATAFYVHFYSAIAEGRSVKEAVAHATWTLTSSGVPNARIPKLFCRPGIDPATVFLASGTA